MARREREGEREERREGRDRARQEEESASIRGCLSARPAHLDLFLGQPGPVRSLLLFLDVEEELARVDASLGLL